MVGGESLRRDVEQAALAGARQPERVPASVGRQRGVQRGRADTATIQLVHLILHQRDEWRDDERRTWKQECR